MEEFADPGRMLNEALLRASKENRAKSIFLDILSHDIRTQMNAIIGFTGLAQKHADSTDRVTYYLSRIARSSDRMLSIINDILDVSRIESGKVVLDRKPCLISELVSFVLSSVQEQANAKQIEIDVDTREVKNDVVVCDRLRFSRALINVLSNSIQYSPNRGMVELRVWEEGRGKYFFKIKDSGVGMTPEFVKKIFEPFSRVKESEPYGINGIGLGMSLVKNIIDMMGGEISVESRIGRGTDVTIAVDFGVGAGASDVTAPPPVPGSGKVRRVLLVEDNDINREIATAILVDNGFDAEAVENGKLALEKVKLNNAPNSGKSPYDLILMDVQMPVMNGYEASKAIREWEKWNCPRKRPVPIVAMTANAFVEDRNQALASGMNEYLAKPIKVKQLLDCIAKFG